MASFTEVQEYLEKEDENYAEIKDRFEEYMGALHADIKQRNCDLDEHITNELIDEVENYIMSKLYKHIFPKRPTKHDSQIYSKMMSLQWMKPQHFDIPPDKQQPEMWELAIKELNKVREAKSPREKLDHLIQAFKIGADGLTLFARKKGDLAGLDDILPVFTYIILRAKVPFLDTNLKYIDRFRNKEKLLGEAGFCKTHVQTAISYFLTLKGKSLEMNEKEFELRMLQESRDSMMDQMLETTKRRKKSGLRRFKLDQNKLRMELQQVAAISEDEEDLLKTEEDEGEDEGEEDNEFELFEETTQSFEFN